jgi:hypothetical protein
MIPLSALGASAQAYGPAFAVRATTCALLAHAALAIGGSHGYGGFELRHVGRAVARPAQLETPCRESVRRMGKMAR